MSSKVNCNVHIASSNLTLEQIEFSLQQPEKLQPMRFQSPQLLQPAAISSAGGQAEEQTSSGVIAKQTKDPRTTPESNREFIVVSVPTIPTTAPTTPLAPVEQLEERLQRLPQKVHSVPFIEASGVSAAETSLVDQPSTPTVPNVLYKGSKVRVPDVTKADISERPDDWLPDRDADENRSNKQAQPLNAPKQAFSDLTDQVLEHFPVGSCSVLMVADVDGRSSGHTVAYQLASQLADRKIGRVLVIDSHFENRELTDQLLLGGESGLADLLFTGETVVETLCKSELPNLDVLPVGTERMCKRRDPNSTWIADNIRALKDEYQFVIVAVGNVFHRSTGMWAPHCDASYMAIELGTSNQMVAKSGVVRLQQYGARLMGCVVTNAAA